MICRCYSNSFVLFFQHQQEQSAVAEAQSSLKGRWEIMGREVLLYQCDAQVMATAVTQRKFGK